MGWREAGRERATGGRKKGEKEPSWAPIDFHSEKIPEKDLCLAPYHMELLAIRNCLAKWKYILQGLTFHVMTDHEPLVQMFWKKSKFETHAE